MELQGFAKPTALLAGGELTLQVKGAGVGGRNQEFLLGALPYYQGGLILSLGTDGIDGNDRWADRTPIRSHRLQNE